MSQTDYEYGGMMAEFWDLFRGDTSNWAHHFFNHLLPGGRLVMPLMPLYTGDSDALEVVAEWSHETIRPEDGATIRRWSRLRALTAATAWSIQKLVTRSFVMVSLLLPKVVRARQRHAAIPKRRPLPSIPQPVLPTCGSPVTLLRNPPNPAMPPSASGGRGHQY